MSVTSHSFSLQHWTNINEPISHSVAWPQKRNRHVATHLSGSLFVIKGGMDLSYRTLNDIWLCDTTTKLWKKVLFYVSFVCVHKEPIMFNMKEMDSVGDYIGLC